MNKIKIILSYILGFILSICLVLIVGIFVSKKTILNKKFMSRLMDENNYYELVYQSISEEIEDYMTSSGLEKEILNNVIIKDNVKNDIDNYMNSLYENKLYIIDTSYVENTLKDNINNYLKNLNLGVDNTNELDLFISDIGGIYKKQVSFYNTLDILNGKLYKISNLIDKYSILLYIITLLLIIIILIIRYINIGSVILSSGFMILLLKIFIYERIDVENVLLISDYFSNIIKSIFKYVGKYMINISIILIVLGFILCLFKNRKNNLEKGKTN